MSLLWEASTGILQPPPKAPPKGPDPIEWTTSYDDGAELKCLTGIDDHSQFCVSAGLMRRAIAKNVCAIFAEALGEHGVPDEILTDNGLVFTGRYAAQRVEVLFDKICRDNGIRHLLTTVQSPTATGGCQRGLRTCPSGTGKQARDPTHAG